MDVEKVMDCLVIHNIFDCLYISYSVVRSCANIVLDLLLISIFHTEFFIFKTNVITKFCKNLLWVT